MFGRIKNIFTSDRSKRDILRKLINEEIDITNIKYFTLHGKTTKHSSPNYNYIIINDFLRKYCNGQYDRKYKEFTSGMLLRIDLKIKNGKVSTFEEWIPC